MPPTRKNYSNPAGKRRWLRTAPKADRAESRHSVQRHRKVQPGVTGCAATLPGKVHSWDAGDRGRRCGRDTSLGPQRHDFGLRCRCRIDSGCRRGRRRWGWRRGWLRLARRRRRRAFEERHVEVWGAVVDRGARATLQSGQRRPTPAPHRRGRAVPRVRRQPRRRDLRPHRRRPRPASAIAPHPSARPSMRCNAAWTSSSALRMSPLVAIATATAAERSPSMRYRRR